MNTVWIYVDTSKLATATISRSSLMRTPRKHGFRRTTRKAWCSNMRFWNEPYRPPPPSCDLERAAAPRF
jgi:hypothetical protein